MCGDAGDILTLEPLLTVLERGQSALAARLQTATVEELAREVQSFLGTTTVLAEYSHPFEACVQGSNLVEESWLLCASES